LTVIKLQQECLVFQQPARRHQLLPRLYPKLAWSLDRQRRCNSREERPKDLSRRRSDPPSRQTTSKRKRNGTL